MKSSKETLRELVNFLKIAKKFKTQAELSLDAGYKSETLTQAISKKSGHQAVINNLKIIYRDTLKKSIWDNNSKKDYPIEEEENNQVYEDDKSLAHRLIAAQDQIIALQKELINKNKTDAQQPPLKKAN